MMVFAEGRCDNVRLEASLEMEANEEWSSGWANMTGEMAHISTARKEINQSIQRPRSCYFKHSTVFHNAVLSSWGICIGFWARCATIAAILHDLWSLCKVESSNLSIKLSSWSTSSKQCQIKTCLFSCFWRDLLLVVNRILIIKVLIFFFFTSKSSIWICRQ